MSRQTNVTRKLVVNSPDRKPSVFERLGTKSGILPEKNVCKNWAENGTCPLNKQCKLSRSHTLISTSKRLKSETMKKSQVVHKKCKDEHKKLHSHHSSEVEWEGWELGDLEDADEKVLEKRKQELQRELQLQLKKEKEFTRKKEKRIEKKRIASTSSSSSTTTESSSSSSSTSSSSSEPKKRGSRKRKHSSSSSESVQSFHKQKKTLKTMKAKLTVARKPTEKKDSRTTKQETKSTGIISGKKVGQKKSYSPVWDKTRGRSPGKQNFKKSPQHSPDLSNKNKSSSPRYEKIGVKHKSRNYSPKSKSKDISPKRGTKRSKDSNAHVKEKPKQSSPKGHGSPPRGRKASPSRPRRYDDSEKRRGHHDDQKHSSRKERSKEKDRKRETPRGRSNEYDNNGGLKKGGKILPLKPVAYNKEDGSKKETTRGKSSEKNSTDTKTRDNADKEKNRTDREREKGERDKNKFEREKGRRKKSGDEHERRSVRDRDSDKSSLRSRDERGREKEGERTRFIKERESDRQKERDDALERCRERQRERDRLEKERKEKDDRKHLRDGAEGRGNHERDLPSLLDLKGETPNKSSGDLGHAKAIEKSNTGRENREEKRERVSEKAGNIERDKGSPAERDHDRREQVTRKQGGGDKDQENKRNREGGECRNSSTDLRRSLGEGRRGEKEEGRQWEDARRPSSDTLHERRRTLDLTNGDRRQNSGGRRPQEDAYRRHPRGEGDSDLRDLNHEERRSGRYDHKWMSREESRDEGWAHYTRRGTREPWNGDWPQDQGRQTFSDSERCHIVEGGGYSDQNIKRRNGSEGVASVDANKDSGTTNSEQASAPCQRGEKPSKGEGDALSDISDDPDDILNQDDYPAEESLPNNPPQTSSQQIYIKSNEFIYEQRRPLFECLGERSLDFEEISDEELEEEARATKGIADVLGADWAGLLRETRPKAKRPDGAGSAHRRWATHKLISTTGISLKYAGETFVRKFIDDCKASVTEGSNGELDNRTPSTSDKENDKEENEEKSKEAGKASKNGAKMWSGKTVTDASNDDDDDDDDDGDDDDDDDDLFRASPQILHSIPGLHDVLRETHTKKSSIFSSHNRFKRALSARADLALRRELCNLPSKEPLHFTPPLDIKMFEASIQQFQGGTTMAAV